MLKTLLYKLLSNVVSGPKLTLAGALAITAGLAPIWLAPELAHKVQASVLVLGGLGLAVAPDPKQ